MGRTALRIVSRYVRDSYLVTFGMTLFVLTFVMCVMVLFRITDAIAAGGSLALITKIFLAGLPSAFGFSIPVSIITAALLTFGKLSANGEITAMKGSGIRMLQIMAAPILFALLMSSVCLYLNAELIPTSYHARREALRQLGIESPLQLIEEGRPIRDFPGITFYVGSKRGQNIEDVLIYQNQKGSVARTIRAQRGTISATADKTGLLVDLYEVRIDPFYEDRPGPGTASHFPYVIDLNRLTGADPAGGVKKKSDMTLLEIMDARYRIKQIYPELDANALEQQDMSLRVEFHKRIVLAVACFAFVLLGAPLATKTHRQETTVGIGISLGLIFLFYLFIIAAETLIKHPWTQPHLIVWIPAVVSIGLGLILIKRCD
jgi:lipopolysaccharide export system permease protein